MNNRRFCPEFELGPPCLNIECNGVLSQYISAKTNECWKQCSICHEKFGIKKTNNMLAQSIEISNKALYGIDE